MGELFEVLFVWRVTAMSTHIRYVCLRSVDSGLYKVQSADFFRESKNEQFLFFENQLIELLGQVHETPPEDWHASVEEAITAHDREFNNS